MPEIFAAGNREPFSFSDGIAAFFLLQIFGFVVFQAFLFWLEPENFKEFGLAGIANGLVWIVFFLFFQSTAFRIIQSIVQKNGLKKALAGFSAEEKTKIVCAVVLAVLFALLVADNRLYPFPRVSAYAWQEALFFLGSWALSGFFAKTGSFFIQKNRQGMPIIEPLAMKTIAAFLLFAAGFIAFSFLFPQVLYLFGLMGFGVLAMILFNLLVINHASPGKNSENPAV